MQLDTKLKNSGIQHISLDSRAVAKQDAFLAYVGFNNDARNYFAQAAERGAKAIVYESENLQPEQQQWLQQHTDIQQFAVANLIDKLPKLAKDFYGNPSQHQHIIGVTGTNGKSSIVHGLTQLYSMLNEPTAMIGTLGIGRIDELSKNRFTTPDAVITQRTLREFADAGIETVCMEVSSHALLQDRVANVAIDTAIFTNLTRDHLDYHQTMQAYGEAKSRLYKFDSVEHVIVNLDDPWLFEQLNHIPLGKLVVGITLQNKSHPRVAKLFSVRDIQNNDQEQVFTLQTEAQQFTVRTPLLGTFNVSNVVAMLAAVHLDGFALEEVAPLLARLQVVPGRLQRVSNPAQPLVVVDFAHTPDAMKNALLTLKPHCNGKMICVFGCGGERDRGKRQLMGEVAQHHCDKIIVTDDNPRNEDPTQIAQHILQGIQQHNDVVVMHDRKQAIQHAIDKAGPNDCVLIAGKGHETTQTAGGIEFEFNDVAVAKECLARV